MKAAVTACALLLAGCAAVGPNYRQPQLAVPARYQEAAGSAPADEAQLASWWRIFGDAQLDALVERALAQNLDIAAAAARIREARALERAVGAEALPQISAQASGTRQRISENAIPLPPGAGGSGNGSPGGSVFGLPGAEFDTFRAGFDAAWELDLFGRARREREAAGARSQAAIWNQRDAEVSVGAETASSYLRLRTLQARIANARDELARSEYAQRLVAARADSGLVGGGDLARQSSERATAAAAIAPLEAQARVEIHRLGVLLGASPDTLAGELAAPRPLPVAPQVPPGLPSELLRRRPDIRAAERELAAATADVGVATADLYPRFSLTAMPALVSKALSSLIEWGSRSYSVGAALDWPLFDGGRRRATVAARNARQEQAMVQYRKSVITALEDVENALSTAEGDRLNFARLEEARAQAARAEELARVRYRHGLVTLAEVLDAQARRIAAESRTIETRGALSQDTVALVKAMGGGWQPEVAPVSGEAKR